MELISASFCALVFVWGAFKDTASFPSGAPVEACESLLPRHVHTSPKAPKGSSFTFTASSDRFHPDSRRRKIKVEIRGSPFKGFFVVALDGNTHDRLGTWVQSRGMISLPCSGVTHSDGRAKIGANMIWEPPAQRKSGEVIFMATILESYSSYYSGLIASVPMKKRNKLRHRQKRSPYNWNYTLDDLNLSNATLVEYL